MGQELELQWGLWLVHGRLRIRSSEHRGRKRVLLRWLTTFPGKTLSNIKAFKSLTPFGTRDGQRQEALHDAVRPGNRSATTPSRNSIVEGREQEAAGL